MKLQLYTGRSKEWEQWFAWRPVITSDGTLVWFENVYRKWYGSNYDAEYIYSLRKP
jgi:hypothetical protein